MLQVLIMPPVSYIFALAIGAFVGIGLQLSDVGLYGFSIVKRTTMSRKKGPSVVSVSAIICGVAISTIGVVFLFILIIDGFLSRIQLFALFLSVTIAIITSLIILIPLFMRRRQRR